MSTEEKNQAVKELLSNDEIISLAKQTQYYCDRIIEQADQWLSAEEGNRLM